MSPVGSGDVGLECSERELGLDSLKLTIKFKEKGPGQSRERAVCWARKVEALSNASAYDDWIFSILQDFVGRHLPEIGCGTEDLIHHLLDQHLRCSGYPFPV